MGPMRRRVSDVITGIPLVRQICSSIVPHTSVIALIADLVLCHQWEECFTVFCFYLCIFVLGLGLLVED
jgi:hypothetical protein